LRNANPHPQVTTQLRDMFPTRALLKRSVWKGLFFPKLALSL
jgi:hypothetical protein